MSLFKSHEIYERRAGATRVSALLGSCVFAAAGLGASSAWAGNGLHPRTPVLFPATECMTIVDRSVDPVLHIEYDIPYEDPGEGPDAMMVWEDEVEQSRTHQFFAFCRDHSRQEYLPEWTKLSDAQEALDNGLMPELPTEDNVFDTSVEWAGCWYRINEDEERRPISWEMAAEGVYWDTSAVPAGTYAVRGYTFEPAFNFFWRRAGVVKVVDDASDETTPPALAITNGTEMGQMGMGEEGGIYVFRNEVLALEGCVDAMPGSTLTGYYAVTEGGDLLPWKPFIMDASLADISDGQTWALDFEPPEETYGESIAIRVDVTDPMQRTYSGHAFWLVTVINSDAPVECEDTDSGDSSGFIGPQCETSGGPGSTGGSTTSGPVTGTGGSTGSVDTGGGEASTGSGADTGDDGTGCGCRADSPADGPRTPAALAILGLLAFIPARRRRRFRA